jgi:molecular chaperone DnaK
MPQIEVIFDIDANGILHVSAVDKGTGKQQKISITNASGLSEDEVNRMKEDAERNAEADRKAKEEAETRNQLEGIVFSTEKVLKEQESKFEEADRKIVQDMVDDGKAAIESGDNARIKSTLEKFNQNTQLQQIMAKLYQSDAGGATGTDGFTGEPGATPPPDPAKSNFDDNVVDAEVEDVDDSKKK